MKHICRNFIFATTISIGAAQAQLAVTVTPPKVVGQKAIVQLAMTNNLADKIESAKAVCFLLDEHGKMVGQSTRWVIGGTKQRPALKPSAGAMFNFVIPNPHSFATTNLRANVSFTRVVLHGGKLADVRHEVSVTAKGK